MESGWAMSDGCPSPRLGVQYHHPPGPEAEALGPCREDVLHTSSAALGPPAQEGPQPDGGAEEGEPSGWWVGVRSWCGKASWGQTHTGVQRTCIRLTRDAHRSHSAHAHITPSTNTDTHRAQVAHTHRSHITPNTCNITPLPPPQITVSTGTSHTYHTQCHTQHSHCICTHLLQSPTDAHVCTASETASPGLWSVSFSPKHTWNCTPRTRSPQCRSSFWQDPCPFLPLGTGNLETDVTGSRERQGSWATSCSWCHEGDRLHSL